MALETTTSRSTARTPARWAMFWSEDAPAGTSTTTTTPRSSSRRRSPTGGRTALHPRARGQDGQEPRAPRRAARRGNLGLGSLSAPWRPARGVIGDHREPDGSGRVALATRRATSSASSAARPSAGRPAGGLPGHDLTARSTRGPGGIPCVLSRPRRHRAGRAETSTTTKERRMSSDPTPPATPAHDATARPPSPSACSPSSTGSAPCSTVAVTPSRCWARLGRARPAPPRRALRRGLLRRRRRRAARAALPRRHRLARGGRSPVVWSFENSDARPQGTPRGGPLRGVRRLLAGRPGDRRLPPGPDPLERADAPAGLELPRRRCPSRRRSSTRSARRSRTSTSGCTATCAASDSPRPASSRGMPSTADHGARPARARRRPQQDVFVVDRGRRAAVRHRPAAAGRPRARLRAQRARRGDAAGAARGARRARPDDRGSRCTTSSRRRGGRRRSGAGRQRARARRRAARGR